jgi:hypothetical protein
MVREADLGFRWVWQYGHLSFMPGLHRKIFAYALPPLGPQPEGAVSNLNVADSATQDAKFSIVNACTFELKTSFLKPNRGMR